MTFDSDAALRLVAESLGLVERLGADPINVWNVSMSDRTLVVEITARSTDPITVRGEIAGVMVALSGLGIPELFPVLHAESFGLRAYDAAGEELLWVVSSIEVAGFAGEGRAVEWLANSLFQDNTPAYRRSQADRIIGQIETGLRELLTVFSESALTIPISSGHWPNSQRSRVGPPLRGATVRMPGHFLTTCFCHSYAMPSLITTTGSTMVVSRTRKHSRIRWERSTRCVVRWRTTARSAPTS